MDMKVGSMLRYRREMLVGLLVLGSFSVLLFVPPIPQDPAYHQFADTRTVWGIPNFINVATSLLFTVTGLWGFLFCLKHRPQRAPWSCRTFFGAVIFVGFGSVYYHWLPDNWTLVWDRLPMAVAFMALFVALLSENVNPKLEGLLIVPMGLLGIFSVVYWHVADDLRLYAWVQGFPMLVILILFLSLKERYTPLAYLIGALGLYVLAKLAEVADQLVYLMTLEKFSGHSLKHLLSALAVFVLHEGVRSQHLTNNWERI